MDKMDGKCAPDNEHGSDEGLDPKRQLTYV